MSEGVSAGRVRTYVSNVSVIGSGAEDLRAARKQVSADCGSEGCGFEPRRPPPLFQVMPVI